MIEVEVRNLSFLIGDSRRVVTGHAPETCLTYLPREVAPHRQDSRISPVHTVGD
jgi:hypothetical protein